MTGRLPDWERRLAEVLRAARDRRFEVAVHDCGTFAADAVAAVTGRDPLAALRCRYRAEAAQPNFSGWSPVAMLRVLAATHGWQRVSWRQARRGDLALVRGADGAACAAVVDLSGRSLAAPGLDGLAQFPLDRAAGRAERRLLCFTSTGLQINHGAALVLPNAANAVMRAGDAMLVQRVAAGWQALAVWRASGVDLGASPNDFTNRVVGRAYAEYLANADLATAIPRDDTIPQVTEGTQILALTHTPQAAPNRIRIACQGFCIAASGYAALALFRDGVCVQVGRATNNASWEVPIGFDYEEAAGTTSPIAYTVRAGASSGAMRMNGLITGRLYGGAARTTLVDRIRRKEPRHRAINGCLPPRQRDSSV